MDRTKTVKPIVSIMTVLSPRLSTPKPILSYPSFVLKHVNQVTLPPKIRCPCQNCNFCFVHELWFKPMAIQFRGLRAPAIQGQSLGFTSRSTARVILGQVLSIVTCGSQTHTEVTVCDKNLLTTTVQ